MPTLPTHDSLASRIRLWLLDHPGTHTAGQIAAGIGVNNRVDKAAGVNRPPVTNELARMVRKGTVTKARPEGAAAMGPGVTYTLPPRPPHHA